jgi:O-antigen/teichoic acid export membrane protein
MHAAFDCGITHFDTAPMYAIGQAELALGRFLVGRREQVTVATKVGLVPPPSVCRVLPGRLLRGPLGVKRRFDVTSVRASFERSLMRLRTDYVDVLLLHECLYEDVTEELIDFLAGCETKGLARSTGIATSITATAGIIADWPSLAEVTQVPLDPADPHAFDGSQSRGTITHSSVASTLSTVGSRLRANPAEARRWSVELGVDCERADVLAGLALGAAHCFNPQGIALFSTRIEERIGANLGAALDCSRHPDRVNRFIELLRNGDGDDDAGGVPPTSPSTRAAPAADRDADDADPLMGSGWRLMSFAATKAITFSAMLVLVRLLSPSDFGILAVATLVLTGTGTVTTLGLRGAIVLIERDDALMRAAGALLLASGVAGAAIVAACSPALASLFGSPRLKAVLMTLSLLLAIWAFTTFHEALLQRELRFRTWFRAQLMQAVVYAAVAIAAAAVGAGIWSLVAGLLAGALAYAAALWQSAPYRVGIGFTFTDARRVLRPARGFLAHGLLDFLRHNLDVGAAAFVIGTRAVGFYSVAFRLADLPYAAFTEPIATTAFPAFARVHRRGAPTSELGIHLLQIVALFVCPMGVLMSATAGPLVHTVLGPRWASAIPALAVLGLWSAVIQVESALGWFANSTGRAGGYSVITGGITLLLLPAVIVAANADGIVGIAWAVLGSVVLATLALMLYVRRFASLPLRRQLGSIRGVVAGAVLAWPCARLIVAAMSGLPSAVVLLTSVSAGLLVYVVVAWLVSPTLVSDGARFVSRAAASLREVAPSADPR